MRIQRLIPTVLVGVLALLVFSAAPVLAATETPVARPATAVTGNSAVLHGELNPGAPGEPGEYYFKVKQSAVACFPEAHEFPEEPYDQAIGGEKEAVEVEATNLEPNQTYSYCLVEEPASLLSTPLTFKTLATAKPFIYKETTTATEVGTFSATLNAAVNPEEQQTTYAFEYATNEALTGAKTIPGKSPLPPQEYFHQEVPASVSSGSIFAAETTYYFRIAATNSTGTTLGPVEHFTTQSPAKPGFISENVSAVNSYEPKFEARINPNYEETTYSFEYSTKATSGVLEDPIKTVEGAPPAPDLPAVLNEEPGLLAGPVGVSGLQAGVVYHYRAVVNDKTSEEDHEPVYGPVEEFTADGAPAVSTAAATSPTQTTATVSGTVTPQGVQTTYHLAYIPQAEYEPGAANPYARGKSTYVTKLTEENGTSIEDYTAHPVTLTLEELQPDTTYDYALIATNELGTITGPNQTFTTAPPTPPLVSTGPAQAVSQLSALITGTVDTQGLATTMQFEFGTTPYGGGLSSATIVTSTGTVDTIAHTFTNDLQPGTTYYYRAIASNQDGEVDGAEQSFTTPGFPAALAPPTVLPFVPYTSLAVLQTREAKEGKASAPKALTRGEKLAKALRACRRERGKQRASCERTARKRYGLLESKRKLNNKR